MPKKTCRPEEIIAKLRDAEVPPRWGRNVGESFRPSAWTGSACDSGAGGMRRAVAHPQLTLHVKSQYPCCRQTADKTRHHGPSRAIIAQHRTSPEPWTVQHNRTRTTTTRHAFGRFPKPGVAGSIPAGGATFSLRTAPT
jgi:hypothetical protein